MLMVAEVADVEDRGDCGGGCEMPHPHGMKELSYLLHLRQPHQPATLPFHVMPNLILLVRSLQQPLHRPQQLRVLTTASMGVVVQPPFKSSRYHLHSLYPAHDLLPLSSAVESQLQPAQPNHQSSRGKAIS